MTDPRGEPLDEPADRWLAIHHDRLVTGLTTDLDLDLGLRGVTLPDRPRALATDLADSLDLDAGLAAILLPRGNPAPPPPAQPLPAQPPPAQPSAADLARAISDAPPAVRLHLRVWTLALADAMDLAGILDRAIDLDPDLDLDRVRALAADLVYAHDLVLALDRDLALQLAHARSVPAGYARTRGLPSALARARDLARARARARARDLARALDLEPGGEGVPVASEIHGGCSERLRHAVTDVIGADLTGADLTGVPLDGIRWSQATRWPPPWAQRVHRHSVPIGDGVYEYRSADVKRGC